MAKYGLHRLNIASCRQHFGRQGASAAVRRSMLDTGLPVEPGDISNYVPSIDTAKSPVIPTYDAISATPH